MPLQKSYSERVGLSKVRYQIDYCQHVDLLDMAFADVEDRTAVRGNGHTVILPSYKLKDRDLYRPCPMSQRQN